MDIAVANSQKTEFRHIQTAALQRASTKNAIAQLRILRLLAVLSTGYYYYY